MSVDRLLVMSPERLTFATSPGGNVLVNIDHAHDLGLAPGIHLAMELSPNEARPVARALLRKADEAEATIRTGYGSQLNGVNCQLTVPLFLGDRRRRAAGLVATCQQVARISWPNAFHLLAAWLP